MYRADVLHAQLQGIRTKDEKCAAPDLPPSPCAGRMLSILCSNYFRIN